MSRVYLAVCLILSSWLDNYGTDAFDIKLDTKTHQRGWKFKGEYSYADFSNSSEVETIVESTNKLSTQAEPSARLVRAGIWYAKFGSKGPNKWSLKYSLSHLLFAQGWVSFLAHPSVSLNIQASRGKEIKRYWSDGVTWCDAVFDMDHHNTFVAETTMDQEEEYAMIDKVVLGIMTNITVFRKPGSMKLNPCLEISNETETDSKGRMSNETRQGPKEPESSTNSSSQASNGISKEASTSSSASVKTFATEREGAKCDCVCTCATPTSNNATTVATTVLG